MHDAILTINAGSSSIKFALFDMAAGGLRQSLHGQIERLGDAPRFAARDADGRALGAKQWPAGDAASHEDVFAELLDWIDHHLGDAELVAAGHRVVHGGQRLTEPARVDDALIAELEALVPLAPLHQPHAIAAIRAVAGARPALPQAACFDTAFHHRQPEVARRYALPRELSESGVLRYGFHGLSYEYIAGRLRERHPALAAGRVVVAHLGNGASLCALRDGVSIDTTMGFTALDGLPMGTRCGALDPGVVLYLQQARGMSAAGVEDLLYHRSGLLGVSGVSADMRALTASDDPRAAEAIALFCYRIARETGALAASLGGLDGIVFTAGIGEHTPLVRAQVCERLGWLGVALDDAANAGHAERISTPDSRVTALVLPTDEEAMIARHTRDVLQQADR